MLYTLYKFPMSYVSYIFLYRTWLVKVKKHGFNLSQKLALELYMNSSALNKSLFPA